MSSGARPWGWAAVWGVCLAVLFFGSYNAANHFTAQRDDVGVYVMSWEYTIPFVAWTIIPYWSIDLFYGIALFTAPTKVHLFRLGKRLLIAQGLCIAGFLLWPLHFSFLRPVSDGIFGAMFDALTGFDLPYNQAPSLHICLLVVLWRHYSSVILSQWGRGLLHVWFALIGVSVLTTYQHHAIDVILGFWVGAICLVLVPSSDVGWRKPAQSMRLARWRIAGYYGIAALFLFAAGMTVFPHLGAWLLYWLGGALAMVAAIYALGDAVHFGKRNGRMACSSWVVFAPYWIAARLNVWFWTRSFSPGVAIVRGLFLGRQPNLRVTQEHGVDVVVDLCAELPSRVPALLDGGTSYLDLVPLSAVDLKQVAARIQEAHTHGSVWVCCALGMSRSAASVVAWLVLYQGYTLSAALQQVRQKRPIVLSSMMLDALSELKRNEP